MADGWTHGSADGSAAGSAHGSAADSVDNPPFRAGPLLILSATEFETARLRARLVEAPLSRRPREASRLHHWPPTLSGTLDGVPVILAASGIGKANAAAAVAGIAAGLEPGSPAGGRLCGVLQVGIGGAYPGSGLKLGAAVVAASEFDLDLGVGSHPKWSDLTSIGFSAFTSTAAEPNRILHDVALVTSVREACGITAAAFATSDSVTADVMAAELLATRYGVEVESMEGVAAAQVAAALRLPFVEIRGISNRVGERDKGSWRVAEAVTAACAAAGRAATVMWEHR